MTVLDAAPGEILSPDDHNSELLFMAEQIVGEPTASMEEWFVTTAEVFVLLKGYFRHLRQNLTADFEDRPEVLYLFSDAADKGIQELVGRSA